jgi:hypothetical protein
LDTGGVTIAVGAEGGVGETFPLYTAFAGWPGEPEAQPESHMLPIRAKYPPAPKILPVIRFIYVHGFAQKQPLNAPSFSWGFEMPKGPGALAPIIPLKPGI